MKHSEKINKILFKIHPNDGINKTVFSPPELRELFNANHITNSSDYHDNRVYLTDKGKAYVEELKSDKHRFWIPVIISLVALFRPEIISLFKYFITLLIEK